jgi:hypothetical protein
MCELLKRAQRYSVQLYLGRKGQFEIFREKGAIHAIRKEKEGKVEEIYYLDQQYYNEEFGLSEDASVGLEFLCY